MRVLRVGRSSSSRVSSVARRVHSPGQEGGGWEGGWAFGLANARADEESFEFYGGSGIVGSI